MMKDNQSRQESPGDGRRARGALGLRDMLAISGGVAAASLALLGRGRRQAPARRKAHRMGQSTQTALQEFRDRIEVGDPEVVRQEVTRRVGQAISAARTELEPRARQASERLRDDIAPSVRDWAQDAIDEAESVVAAARQRAGGMAPAARKAGPPITAGAATALVGAGAAVSGAATAIGDRLGDVLRRSQPSSGQRARRAVTDTGSRVITQTGSRMKHAGGQSLAIVGWTGVLGAVVYFGLFSPAQRARVRGAIVSAVGQIRDLAGDFDGIFEGSSHDHH